MAIAKMQKFSLTALNHQKNEILNLLQDSSLIQIIDLDKDELKKILKEDLLTDQLEELEFDISELRFAIDYLAKYDPSSKQSIIQSFMGDLPEIKQNQFDKNILIDYKKTIDDLKNIEAQTLEIQRQKEQINEKLTLVRQWSNLKINPSKLKELTNFETQIGAVDKNRWQDFKIAINKTTKLLILYPLANFDEQIKDQQFIIIYPKNENTIKNIQNTLTEYSFEKNDYIESLNSTVSAKITTLKEKYKHLLQQSQTLEQKTKTLVPQRTALMCIYEQLNWQDELCKIKQKSIQTKGTFTIFFWIKTMDIKKLEKTLDQKTKFYYLQDHKINQNEEPPIELVNSKLIKPFEAVTNIYGMPKYSEPDPTTWLAPFFILFFALCLTDAGYGVIIVLITYFMLKKWDFILIRLLNYAGWATIVIGALTGGWFGIDLSTISIPWLQNALTSIRLIDPINDPITMMLISLALGIVQIWIGIACKAYWNIKNKKTKEALLDQFPWLYLLITLIGFALASTNVINFISVDIWKILLYIAVAIIIITQSRNEKNIFLRPFTGAIKLYDVIGYLSDTLSYTRLLALGLATAIIAFVINIIADLTRGIPYVGILIFIIVLIGGHTFNLAINLLGSFIHSARLQYVEFFSKFMEGGGDRFKPFAKKSTYIKVNKN